MRYAMVFALQGALIPAGSANAATDPALLAETCTTCHGVRLAGAGDMPALTGKSAADLITSLTGFRDGTMPATIMTRLVKPLSDDEIAALAAFLAKE